MVLNTQLCSLVINIMIVVIITVVAVVVVIFNS